jgi:hypothetical protein
LRAAAALVEYHVHRNAVARKSRGKTWRAKQRDINSLRLEYHLLRAIASEVTIYPSLR